MRCSRQTVYRNVKIIIVVAIAGRSILYSSQSQTASANAKGMVANHGMVVTPYTHTSWSWRDGFRAFPIQALAQTEDGYLWIGTRSGLWRFDGVQFTEWRPTLDDVRLPSPDIRSLDSAHGPVLWIGTAAGISKLENRRLTNFSLGGGARVVLADSPRGAWVATAGNPAAGLVLFGSAAAPNFAVGQLPDQGVNTIFRDHTGTLWIGTRRGLCRWENGKVSAFLTEPATEIYAISEDSSHRLVIACNAPARLMYLAGDTFLPLDVSHTGGSPIAARVLLGDRDGSIWIGTFSDGLAHVHHGNVHWYSHRDGLSGSIVQALLQDADRNIWVGTRTGLDRYRPSTITHISQDNGLSEDLVTTIYPSRDGGVWVGTATAGLNYLKGDSITTDRIPQGLKKASVLSLLEDQKGSLWIGTTRGLQVLSHSSVTEVLGIGGRRLERVTALASDKSGGVFAADGALGAQVVSEKTAEPLRIAGLPPEVDIYSMMVDRLNRLWLGYYHGELAVVDNNRVRRFITGRDLAPGPVLSLHEDSDGSIWVCSQGGLSRLKGGRWTAWTVASGKFPSPLLQVISDDIGALWVFTGSSVLRFAKEELDADAASSKPPHFLSYGISQGIPPQAVIVRAQPRVSKLNDGSLWFAGDMGVASIDPTILNVAGAAAHVMIDQIKIDGRAFSLDPAVHGPVAFRGHELQLSYTATSLSGYDDVQFSYYLRGFDRDQVPAGAEHSARYTNLSPGHYQFVVTASSNQGVWTAASSPLEIVVSPEFYQTLWFRSSCAAVIGALILSMYRLRLHQLSRKFELLTQTRLAERTRIATDLHDTLLQSVVGASLQLEAISKSPGLSSDAPKDTLRHVRDQLDRALYETRTAVWALRSPILAESNLPSAMQQAGKVTIGPRDVDLAVRIQGDPFRFPIETEEQLFRIGQEAISNAIRHSQCSHIVVDFTYSPNLLTMQISDNGRGFDLKAETNRPGHFGLAGIRERAAQLGASLVIAPSSSGTRIAVSVSRSLSVRDLRQRLQAWKLWRFFTYIQKSRQPDGPV
jgi:signal transduction histidine kinase/ligand-binding sensor domain-containing protein